MKRSTVAAVAAAVALGAAGVYGATVWLPEHQVKRSVVAYLKDPDSAKFDRIRFRGEIACGRVNARNAMGGYAGFRRFVSHGPAVQFEPDDPALSFGSEKSRLLRESIDFEVFFKQQCG